MMKNSFELERFIPYRLSVLTNTVSQGISQSYLDRFDIGVTEWRVIAVLGPCPGLTASEVIERTAMEKVPISRAVRSLVDKGLLQRKTDLADRRCRRLHLTPNGRKVFDDIVPRAKAYEAALLECLTQKEQETLNTLLKTLKERATTLKSA